jgi:hypothetical protein
MVEPVSTTVVTVGSVICAIAGISIGAASTFTSSDGQNLAEYSTTTVTGIACASIPVAGQVFAGSYGVSKVATHLMKMALQVDSASPEHVTATMKMMGIEPVFYEGWRFFGSEDKLVEDIVESWNKDRVYKLGFAINTGSGPIFFSLSQIDKDFLTVNDKASAASKRNAIGSMFVRALPAGPGTAVGERKNAGVSEVVRDVVIAGSY